jgi:hypothetical protein
MDSITWKTMEFEEKERHPDWLWTVGLVAALTATISFFYGNIFFGILLLIAGAVTILYALQKPKELTILINDKGITINDSLIEYKSLPAFWLDETGKQDTLLLLVKGSFVPQLSLPLSGVKTDDVRAVLSKYTKEEEMRQSRSIALFDRIGY